MNNILMVILTSLPDNIQGVWNYDILGYTTIGAMATYLGGFIYTLIKAKAQRKILYQSQKIQADREDKHYKELLERLIKLENKASEQDDDIVLIADTSFRKEVKQIVEKHRNKKDEYKPKIDVAEVSNIVEQGVDVVKKIFR